MDKINELTDDLLVKILSFVPATVAVSTSILSKRWEFLWMWVPKLEYIDYNDMTVANRSRSSYLDFINKNMSLRRAPIIESLLLGFYIRSLQPEDLKVWLGIAVSRCVRELSINYSSCSEEPDLVLPTSLYTCKSLVTLELEGRDVLVDMMFLLRFVSLP
ncbi:unnamed protein product [Microthlaspi erraticum]|uniref:F-box domain-containing protein n=1 Tax=Microthlaspi erraticum TaxID=1685480 RepID=A0A6D2KS02_9BRAS|nr:unnamed protein product [Microthlaspi erraticum]